MKLALFFLTCFFSVAMQQNVQWALPTWSAPFNPYNQLPVGPYGPIFAPESRQQHYPNLVAKRFDDQWIEEPSLAASSQIKPRTNADPRVFGLTGINYLASLFLNSLSVTSTSTVFTTSTSTVTGATVRTCFISTMFSATTACRRKRDAVSGVLIGDHYDNAPFNENYDNAPFNEKSGLDILPREGRDVNLADVLASSRVEQDVGVVGKRTESSINRYVRQITATETKTSTVTAYSVFMQTSVRTVTNLAATTALTCLPSGFTLC